ncbi:ATP-binding cassette domain-containing protein [Agromyces archimandritae]|uniref:ABC transporter ATP-binding protein n=1 Tax=Agromyces archimandritae TaxID=2781962 RepID=A0A975FND2_9MICO|nr:ABC transporter ATP-binding protein [Agromyces archimandritae]QTX04678.1 ABC transporter ATP-binding protein [Agromyces archimandritae]
MSLVDVTGLGVAFGDRAVVQDVSFAIEPGECTALVGESGSGKSLVARSLLGLAGPGARVSAERIGFEGRDLRAAGEREWRRIRGSRIGLVLQDALVSLDPLRPVGREIGDVLRLHTRLRPAERAERVVELLERVGMPDAAERAKLLPGALSGGLRQRALIAQAIALDPPFLIADEPTTALDAVVQHRVLGELARLKAAGTALLLISHDLGVVAGLADRVLAMHDGRIVEAGPTERVLASPEAPETRALLAALPGGVPRGARLMPQGADAGPHAVDGGADAAAPAEQGAPASTAPARTAGPHPVLRLEHVVKRFGPGRAAVDGASLELAAGRTLGIVGESGSGKTTIARLALGLLESDAGRVELFGEPWSGIGEHARRPRRRRIGLVSQDTHSSFDPRWSAGHTLRDALGARGAGVGEGSREAVAELLASVGLSPEIAERHPARLSGGQRQRLAIARALAARPEVLVLDEPVSALDLTVQARVLDLLDELQRERGLAYLLISHDLDVIGHMSDEIAVMRAGRIVEHGPAERLLARPAHPYTAELLAAAPRRIRTPADPHPPFGTMEGI